MAARRDGRTLHGRNTALRLRTFSDLRLSRIGKLQTGRRRGNIFTHDTCLKTKNCLNVVRQPRSFTTLRQNVFNKFSPAPASPKQTTYSASRMFVADFIYKRETKSSAHRESITLTKHVNN